ncbi:metallophosphoesterase [Pontibacter pamirensis]|uniref:metallophosphoesterase n=1 Tax=Pontibacter pamirensis TaxID=2562824 RepID=UPI00138A3B00|nr:metallophosphoesterase [Pontibacter pamirensis]
MSNSVLSIPAKDLPQFEELYAISDLHLGGTRGFQIFNAAAELKSLVQHLRTSVNQKKKVGLVINGDFVDLLAENQPVYFDPVNAVDKLKRIAEDDAFAPVFEALKEFAATKNRFLILNLGNHDLELALPWVRECLLKLLTGGNELARGRITFAFDGTGYLCMVGKALVLCVHGNEVDNWNLTDHEKIRRISRDVVQGRPVTDWIPNAGTQLVIDVMNNLKRKFPFIDLLKPEVPAVIPTLIALAPDQLTKVQAIGATAARLWWDGLRRSTGFLGNQEEMVAEMAAAQRMMSSSFLPELEITAPKMPPRNDSSSYADALLQETERRLSQGEQPMSLIDQDRQGEYLGKWSAAWKYIWGEEPSEVLREALEKLREDESFDLSNEDDTFVNLDSQIGADIDFLIAGHTHLARARRRKKGRGWYYNSGTWIRLIRLTKEVLESKEEFKKVFETFKNGKMEDLDAHKGLVMRRLTLVKIAADGTGTTGELQHASLDGEKVVLTAAPESRFTKI